VVFVSCPSWTFDQRIGLLAAGFGFTPTELRLCRGRLEGFGLPRAGTLAGLSYETARWYLTQVFARTDTHRQAELVRLLLSVKAEISLPPLRSEPRYRWWHRSVFIRRGLRKRAALSGLQSWVQAQKVTRRKAHL
jgi:DNA-binding CsgD family transcriptional regulator